VAKKKAAVKKANGKAEPPEKRQGDLPGMEDRAIAALEALAEQYVDIRDKRMRLNEREVELNEELLALMKKHGKTEYHHDEVHCWIKATDEKVKVKLGELPAKASKAAEFTPEDEAVQNGEGEESGPDHSEPQGDEANG
jgi:hypothetical protein